MQHPAIKTILRKFIKEVHFLISLFIKNEPTINTVIGTEFLKAVCLEDGARKEARCTSSVHSRPGGVALAIKQRKERKSHEGPLLIHKIIISG